MSLWVSKEQLEDVVAEFEQRIAELDKRLHDLELIQAERSGKPPKIPGADMGSIRGAHEAKHRVWDRVKEER
jgi:hypothetical protein